MRRVPPRNRFRYPLAVLALDLDELPALDARLRLFGHNRRRPVALHDRDYLDGEGGLGPSVRRLLRGRDPGGAIVLVTLARVLGYVFNPVSFFLCHDRAGDLAEVIAEVNNTYGGTRRYLLERRGGAWEADKALFVSPFLPDEARYRFRFAPLGEALDVRADLLARADGEPRLLHARLRARRVPLDDASLLRSLLRTPLQAVQVIARIHLQALKLRFLGAPERAPS